MDYPKLPLMVLTRLFPLHIPSSLLSSFTPCPCYRRNEGSKTRFWRAEKAACLMNPSQSVMFGHRLLDCSLTSHWMILVYYKHSPLLQECWELGHPMWWMGSNQRWNWKVPRDFTIRRGNGHTLSSLTNQLPSFRCMYEINTCVTTTQLNTYDMISNIDTMQLS